MVNQCVIEENTKGSLQNQKGWNIQTFINIELIRYMLLEHDRTIKEYLCKMFEFSPFLKI